MEPAADGEDAAGSALGLWFRSLGPAVMVLLLAVLAMAAALVPLYVWGANVALVLGVDGADQVSPRRLITLLVVALAPWFVVLALVTAAVVGATVLVAARLAQGQAARPVAAFRAGLRRSPRVATVLALALGSILLAFVATPFLVIAGLVALVLTPLARLLQRRWSGVRWPSLGTLAVIAIPFGLAAALVIRWSLALPAAVLERRSVRASFSRSLELTRSETRRVATIAVTCFLVPVAVLGILNHRVLADATSVVGPQVLSTLTGLLVLTLAVVGGVVLYDQVAGPADLASADAPPPSRTRVTGTLAVFAVLAAAIPLGLVWTHPASASAGATLVVDDLGDAPDAVPGDAVCDDGTGACTLRAALDEANASSDQVIGFGVDGRIVIGSTLAIRQPVTIDGTGRRVTVSGGGATSVFVTQIEVSGGGSATIRSLTIADGFEASTGGAAIYNSGASGGEGLVLDRVTVRDNVTAPGALFGGAIVNVSKLTVRNSTFSGNDSDPSTDGSDIANVFSGTALVSQSTFVGSSGSSALTSSSSTPAEVTNSLITGSGFACSGSFTGSGNVTTDPTAICPGTAGVSAAALGLTALGDNGGVTETVRILPSSVAVDAGDAAACTATDQRGAARPKGAGCDAGAYEVDPSTSTALTVSPTATGFGGAVTFEVAVAATAEPVTPSGEVELFDGASSLGRVALDGSGSATRTITTLSVGPHDLSAAYVPDAGLAASTSPVRSVTVDPAASTLVLTSSGSPSRRGEAVTFHLAVTGADGGIPSGTVTLRDGATPVATVPLDGLGRADVVTDALADGPHMMVAEYSGDTSHEPATSAALAHDVVGSTTTVLHPPTAPTTFGTDATFEVEVTADEAGPTPTGGVILVAGSTTVGLATLGPDGTALVPVATLPAGTSSVIATYAGDGYHDTSTSAPVDHVVIAADTATTLSASPAGSTPFGAAITFDVAVTATGTPAVPSGTVTIYDGADAVITVGLQPDGTASTVQVLPAGSHDLRADYAGPGDFRSSTSTVLRREVTAARTSVELTAGSATSVTGEPVALTASVANLDSSATPSGSVTFRDGARELATVAVDGSGRAHLDTAGLVVGARTLTATFDGGTDFASSTSTGLAHRVDPAEVRVTVVAAPGRSWFGSLVTVDATVVAISPGTGMPTGSVTFRDGASALATVDLDATGRASIGTYAIGVGERTLVADYGGDGDYRPGTGSTVQTVDPDATTVTVLSSEPDQRYGRPVELTAAVVGTGSGRPTGLVTFTGAGRTLGAAVLDGSGRARITVSDLPVGTTLVSAAYDGDGNFIAGTGTLIQRVTAGPTTTALAVAPASPSVADVVVLTATVTAPDSSLVPGGSVEFSDRGVVLATVALDPAGVARFEQRFDRSSHELQARFVGTSSWAGSMSSREELVPTRVTAPLVITAEPGAVAVGGTVTLRAALAPVAGAGTPTGVIHFTDGSGTLGSAVLVDGAATLVVSAPLVPGAWSVSGWYPGDLAYEPVAPTAATVVVGAAPTSVSVATIPNPGYALDGPVTVRAHVTSGYGGAPIGGTVRFTSDSPVLVSDSAVVDGDGFAEITIVDVPAGTWNLRAEYLPSSGSAYAGSVGTSTHRSVRRASTTAISVAPGLQVGRPSRVSVTVTDATGSVHRPTGRVVVDAGGITCTTAAPSGSCEVVLPTAGPVTFTAFYEGDDRFDGSVASASAPVSTATPVLRASSATRPWVTGDPITIDWSLAGPTTGTVTVQTAFGVACTTPAAASGSCTTTLPFDARGQAVDVVVSYAGGAGWDPAFATVSQPVLGCYPVAFTGVPSDGGTVTGPDGNCNAGTGFVEGTSVTAIATPSPGHVLRRWLETDSTAQAYRFAVGELDHSATAVFSLDCVTVRYRAGQAPGVDPAGSASGSVALSSAPDCGAAAVRDPATGTTTAEFRRGTALSATAVSTAAGRGEFKGWAVLDAVGRATYPTEPTIDLDLTGNIDLTANFGARCYQPQVTAEGPGSAAITTAPNCIDPVAGRGYLLDTSVAIEATPGAFHYVGPMATDAGATVDPAAFTVRGDTPITVRFDPCRQLTTATTGSGRGSVQVSEPSTCPGGEPGWYVPGEITLSPVAAPGYQGRLGLPVEPDRFKRWVDEDGLPLQERAPLLRLDMSQDRRITAVFTSPSRCAPITVGTESPAWLGSLEVRQGSDLECDSAEEYVQGEPFTLQAAALQGAPLVQWKVSGLEDYAEAALSGKSTAIPSRTRYRSQLPGATVAVPAMYGDVTATAYACAALTTDVGLVDDAGDPVTGSAPDGFVRFDQAPTCPGTGNGWLVGDTVGYLAGAQPVGYQFLRWDGDVSGTDQEGTIELDGSRPTTVLKPVYQVRCFTLTVTPAANTARGEDPNCPGADPSEGRYVGGSVVALHAFDGGEVWVGWEGDVDRKEDPTWVYVDDDATAHARWRDKTTGEDIKDFFTDVGDVLAVGAKKLVGVAIVAATALLDSALTAAMGAITLVATAIDAIAGALGSPSDGGFREAMVGIQQTAALFSSPFSCGSEWAFADATTSGVDGGSLGGTGGDLKDLIKDPRKLNEKLGQYRSSIEEIEDTATGWAASVKKFGVRAKLAKSAGGTGLTAIGVGTALASADFGVEDTAAEAWGSESGRAFMSCMEQALPDYWNVPPLGFSDS